MDKGLRHITEDYTMPVMAKKKAKADTSSEQNMAQDESGPVNILLRGLEPSLVEALDQHAQRTRRSRNVAIILLLEEAMQKQGLWSPQVDAN
jgi:hypothetical protein